jgi:hypothetical protein
MPETLKRNRGRPLIFGTATKRYQVRLPPAVAAKLQVIGEGSLSKGIVKTFEVRPKRSRKP